MRTKKQIPKGKLHGLVAAVHTPFHTDGSLNLETVEKQAAHLLAHQITLVFLAGSTGESQSLSAEERRQLAQRWADVARGTPLRLVVHVGSNCLDVARSLARHAQQIGAMAVAAHAPFYFKPRSVGELIDWCAEIAAAAPDTPFYFYDIPALTGVNLSMPEFLERAPEKIPTLAGIKFTNSNLMAYQLCLHAAGGRFDIPYGTDEWLLAALALGAKGAVGSSYNLAAPIYHRLWTAFKNSQLARARQEQFRSVQLIQTLAAFGYMGASKAVMKMLGVDVGPARLPHTNPDGQQLRRLRNQLDKMGFWDWLR